MALIPQLKLLEQLLGTNQCFLSLDTVVPCLYHQNILHQLKLVEVEFLGDQPDTTLELQWLCVKIMTKHLDMSRGLGYQSREDAYGCGFASPVGAQQGKEVAFAHVQVNTLEGNKAVGIGFVQPPDR